MSRGYKILVSVLALIFGIGAAGMGYMLVGSSALSFPMRFLCNFFFFMQFLTAVWLVIAIFRKEREN